MAAQPSLPIPISLISGRYLLFSIDVVTYLRREHHICGVLVGTLPQIPQQSVFLGLPLELMPEEARLLVEKDVAYIVDDVRAHGQGMRSLAEEDCKRYIQGLEREGREASKVHAGRKGERRERALKIIENARSSGSTSPALEKDEDEESKASLFEPEAIPSSPTPSSRASGLMPDVVPFYAITPATSYPPLPTPPRTPTMSLLDVPPSYPLFAHLHNQGYYLSPGLRFGCQYLVYPGDPLRFHSHFLAVGMEWDEEIDLMDIVGGGRLGTGVKKGFLIGGLETEDGEESTEKEAEVKTFSIEWAGM